MPIYAYACSACGHKKDALQKLSDPPLVDCPACGQPTLSKQVTAAGFQLKGSGWYVTDFRNNGGSAKPSPGGDAAKASGGTDGTAAPATAPSTAPSTAPATATSASPPTPAPSAD